jgi:hypothetical protein
MGFVGRGVRSALRHAGRVATAIVQLAVLFGLLGGAIIARAGTSGAVPMPAAPLAPITPTTAAAALTEALASREGLSFTVVQHTTIHAKPGGQLLDVADPVDPRKVIGQTDQIEQRSYIERGGVSADGFWMEMRDGPVGDQAPDFANAPYQFGAIVKDGKTYRNDGEGWYPTDQPPGIGIDPATAGLLPRLVTSISKPVSLPDLALNGATTRQLAASAAIADIPGIQAVDLASASELSGPLEYGFDDAGRLVRIHGVVRNTDVKDWDFFVDVVIGFGYGDAGSIPDPAPALRPTGGQG